jgi:hypothetical protein
MTVSNFGSKLVMTALVLISSLCRAASDAAPQTPLAAMQASLKKQQESLDKQRNSLGQQIGGNATNLSGQTEFIAPLFPPGQFNCPRLSAGEIDTLIAPAARKTGIAPDLLHAVMKQESAFRPCAVSEKGALGLMQLMPATAQQFHVADAFDPQQNVQAGAALLKQLLNRYNGDLRLVLAAYNAGANRADASAMSADPLKDPYPAETQHYIAAIFADLGMDQVTAAAGPSDGDPASAPAQ